LERQFFTTLEMHTRQRMGADLRELPASQMGGGLTVRFCRNALTRRGLAPNYDRSQSGYFSLIGQTISH